VGGSVVVVVVVVVVVSSVVLVKSSTSPRTIDSPLTAVSVFVLFVEAALTMALRIPSPNSDTRTTATILAVFRELLFSDCGVGSDVFIFPPLVTLSL
jgi:hypothetical protein